MQHSWGLWKLNSSFLWFITNIKNKISIYVCNTSSNKWCIRKSMHLCGQQTTHNKKNSGAGWKGHSVHCPVWQLEPNKWYFKDEFNFLIYCIWMGNIIGFVLNIKFANVTYCTREWKERLNFFKIALAFRPPVLGMCTHSSKGMSLAIHICRRSTSGALFV